MTEPLDGSDLIEVTIPVTAVTVGDLIDDPGFDWSFSGRSGWRPVEGVASGSYPVGGGSCIELLPDVSGNESVLFPLDATCRVRRSRYAVASQLIDVLRDLQ